MTSVAAFLNEERALLGLQEYPPGSNQNKVTAWYGMVGPWCAMNVSYCLSHAGYTAFRYAYCPSIVNDARRGVNGMQWLPPGASVLAGDLFLWDWNKDGIADHISVAELASPGGGNVSTIGCNENDRCQRTVRNRACLLGIVRLPLDRAGVQGVPSSAPPGKLAEDGDFGPLTIEALQRACGASVDGDFGPLSKEALQRHLGVPADGDVGPQTIHALQVKVGASIDPPGHIGWGPDTTKHLQMALNAGSF